MAEGCDCKSLFLACKHEEEGETNNSQKSEEVAATAETITVSENTKDENCNGGETKDSGTMDSSNLTKVNCRSCPDLFEVRPRSLTFGRLSFKKLGRRKSWKIFRGSQEGSSDCKREEVRKRKDSKTRKLNKVVNRNERQTSTSASVGVNGVVGMFRLRSQSTETKGGRTRRSRDRRSSVFDKVMKLFESDSGEQESANATEKRVLPRKSRSSSEGKRGNSSSSRPLPGSAEEQFAVIEKVVREENLHFFDEDTQRIWRERTKMECFLPRDILSVTNCPYYWGPINRYQAEKILDNLPDGMYLLRDSAQYHYLYSVSFRRYKRTYHARIEQWRHRYSFDKPSEYSFYSRSVCELLQHYSRAEQCMFYEPMLIKPLPRESALPLQALCRAAICSCITFSEVDQLPLPKGLKNYLREYHYKVPRKRTADKGTQTQNMPRNWRTLSGGWWS